MHAIQITDWTPPDRLVAREVAAPRPMAGEVLIDVRAAGLSHALSLLVQGRYQRKPALPFVPGNTVAGRVRATGPGVQRLQPGDRVLAALELGGLAEQAVAHEDNVYPLPPGLPFDEATVLNTAYNSVAAALTWPGLLQLGPGQRLLVTGAAGGVGSAAVQIGRLLGAEVIAAANGEAKRDHALRQGAHVALDGAAEGLRDAVRAATGGTGVDAVLEPVGGAVFDAALRCLRPGGRILPIGFASGSIPQIPANLLLVKNLTVCGLSMQHYKITERHLHAPRMQALFEQLFDWWQRGLIRPDVSRRVTLDTVAEGFADVLNRHHTGHVVVCLPGAD